MKKAIYTHKTCPHCGLDKLADKYHLNAARPGGLQIWCKTCRSERRHIDTAIRQGMIEKTPCIVCGETKVDAHHENYNQMMKVVFYCRKHHVKRHKEMGSANKNG